jgi:Fur family transcriptional regulator, ferric uptake regulator
LQRKTRQRDAIYACFTAENRPLTPVEAHELVAAKERSVGIATVYRAVNSFVAAGTLMAVAIGGVLHYEIAKKEHHHHLLCLSCSKAFCVDGCPLSRAALAPKGFTVESHEITLYGRCRACSKTTPATRRQA